MGINCRIMFLLRQIAELLRGCNFAPPRLFTLQIPIGSRRVNAIYEWLALMGKQASHTNIMESSTIMGGYIIKKLNQ